MQHSNHIQVWKCWEVCESLTRVLHRAETRPESERFPNNCAPSGAHGKDSSYHRLSFATAVYRGVCTLRHNFGSRTHICRNRAKSESNLIHRKTSRIHHHPPGSFEITGGNRGRKTCIEGVGRATRAFEGYRSPSSVLPCIRTGRIRSPRPFWGRTNRP